MTRPHRCVAEPGRVLLSFFHIPVASGVSGLGSGIWVHGPSKWDLHELLFLRSFWKSNGSLSPVKHVLSPAVMLPLSSPSPKRPDPRVCWVSPEDALHRLQPGRRWWESSEPALETANGGHLGRLSGQEGPQGGCSTWLVSKNQLENHQSKNGFIPS